MNALITFLICIVLFSCNKFENKKNQSPLPKIDKVLLEDKMKLSKSIVLKNEIVNNEFANAPLGKFDFINHNLSSFFTGICDLQRQATINKYSNETDTLIVFTRRTSVVRFYKTREKVILDSLDVSTQKFVRFKLGLDIEMNKKDVLKLFNENSISSFADTISIVDEEAASSVKLIFIENKLKRIIVLPW